jgi:hypothetical protein
MKGFLVLLVLSAAGLAGVLYWRKIILAPKPPVAAADSQPAKNRKERPKRRKRGARRLARNEVVARNDVRVGAASPGEAPPMPTNEVPRGEAPARVFAPSYDDRPTIARGASSMTEAAPADVFGSSPSPSPMPSGGGRQVIDEPEPVKLRPADLKIVWQGEDLSKAPPEAMRLDMSNDSGKELSQDEMDARFRLKEDAVLRCVEKARPDEYTEIPGRVTVRFRIQKTGVVKGVQVEAPVILHKGGLTGCIKGVVGSLKFPASNMGQVVSYPFSLM